MIKEKIDGLKPSTVIPVGLDINKIIKRAQEAYGKGEKGISKQLSTGDRIVRPSRDEDFVLWPGDFWFKLTRLKGLPFGKICQISGRPDSGKSTSASVFMASAQASGYYVILLDAEGKFQSLRYDKHMGGNSKNLFVVDTNDIEQGARGVAYMINAIKEENKNAKILVVFDSIGAALSKQESDTEKEEMSAQPMQQAKQINWAIKKFNRLINFYQNKETGEHTIAVLCINQVYAQMMTPGFKEKGGDGLFYLSSLIIQLTRKKDLIKVKSGEKIKYGIVSRAKVRKNHLFDGDECLSETEIVVSAAGINLLDEVKKEPDIKWDDTEQEDGED